MDAYVSDNLIKSNFRPFQPIKTAVVAYNRVLQFDNWENKSNEQDGKLTCYSPKVQIFSANNKAYQ